MIFICRLWNYANLKKRYLPNFKFETLLNENTDAYGHSSLRRILFCFQYYQSYNNNPVFCMFLTRFMPLVSFYTPENMKWVIVNIWCNMQYSIWIQCADELNISEIHSQRRFHEVFFEACSKSTIKMPEQRLVPTKLNNLVLSYLLLTLRRLHSFFGRIPPGIYLFKANNGNTKIIHKICSKLTIKTSERRLWRRSGVLIVNFEQISHFALVFSWHCCVDWKKNSIVEIRNGMTNEGLWSE